MKPKTLLICIVILILSLPATNDLYAQRNFKDGYIVSFDKDTIKGLIDYQNWKRNPDYILYKNELSDSVQILNPSNILSFYVEGEYYLGKILKIDKSPYLLNKLDGFIEPLMELDSVFLLLIVRGKATLYYLEDKSSKKHFFIRYENEQLAELTYKKYLKTIEGVQRAHENNKYKGQLLYYFKDCHDLKSDIENLRYSFKPIKRVFINYNACNGSSSIYIKPNDKKENTSSFLIGLSATKLNFESFFNNSLCYADFKMSIWPTVGISKDFSLSRNRNRWSINTELIFRYMQNEAVVEVYNSENDYSTSYYKFDFLYLRFNNMLRYKFYIGEYSPFFGFGISNSLVLHNKNELIRQTYFYGIENETKGKVLNLVRSYEQGAFLGLGVYRNKMVFEIRYEIGNGISPYPSLGSTSKSIYVLFARNF